MNEYVYNENDKLTYINTTQYEYYRIFDSYILFFIVCTLFGSYFCRSFYICTKQKIKDYYNYYQKKETLKEKLIIYDDICSICLENLKNKKCVILSCEHIYHKICIQKWLKKNDSCPNCRINII